MASIFFFGSLRDRTLLEVVLDRPVADADILPAHVPDRATVKISDEEYPQLVTQVGGSAPGIVVSGLSAEDIARLEYYEEAEYGLADIVVETEAGPFDARYFASTPKATHAGEPWELAAWEREERCVSIEAARELMAHIDITPVERMDEIWPGIKIRAMMRARAQTDAPPTDGMRSPHTAADVESVEIVRPYTRFFAIEDHRLRHRRFDGGWSEEIVRTALVSGDAVTVLPFDPVTRQVLLIEQFRAPIFARGDPNPWSIEVIAGRIDKELSDAETARREAREEAGIELGALEVISRYYSSPGIAAEYITAFAGRADLSGTGGTFGEPTEHEDIRAFAVPLEAALGAAASGEINNGPAVLSIYWLGVNADRLCREWG
ncbi:MAG: NUDIX domain-containing protein [Pseudomonadota bacterium]